MKYPILTATYAGLFGILFVCLSVWVVAGRAKFQVHHGDGGVDLLQRRIRAHGNFSEYLPLALLFSALIESMDVSPTTIHALMIPLVVARMVHPIGMLMPVASIAQYSLRATSVTVTWIVVLAESIILLSRNFSQLLGR